MSDPRPNVGDTITFTVTLSNNGPDSATNVQVTDLLPAGLTFVSATPSQGTYDPVTGVWAVGTVTTAPLTLTIEALVAGPALQTLTRRHLSSARRPVRPVDPRGNNTASAIEMPQQADRAGEQDRQRPDAQRRRRDLRFTVTLTNNGLDAATNVTVHDLLPAGLTFESAVAHARGRATASGPASGPSARSILGFTSDRLLSGCPRGRLRPGDEHRDGRTQRSIRPGPAGANNTAGIPRPRSPPPPPAPPPPPPPTPTPQQHTPTRRTCRSPRP